MKRISLIIFALLLIFHTFFGSLTSTIAAESEQNFTASITLDGDGKGTLDWSFIAGNEDKEQEYNFEIGYGVEAEQNGKLSIEGVEVGSYMIFVDGRISVTILANVEQSGSGAILIEGIQEEEVLEELEDEEAENADDSIEAETEEEGEIINPETESGEIEQTPSDEVVEEPETDHEETNSQEETIPDTVDADNTACDDQSNCNYPLEDSNAPPSEIAENILTGTTLLYEDEQGNTVEIPTIDSIISVRYTWALENGHGYTAGSTFTFNLPNELEVYDEMKDLLLKHINGEIIGYFSVALDGQVIMTFTDFIEKYSNISGSLTVLTELSEEIIVKEEKVITITPIQGEASITIPVSYHFNGPSMDKKGLLKKDNESETIEWTVDFNKTLEEIEGATLSDPIQEGQLLEEGSIKVYHLDVQLNGKVTQGKELDLNEVVLGKTEDSEDFIIDFQGTIHSAYRVIYTTKVTDEDQSLFHNKATLFSNGDRVGVAEATITIKRGSALEKKSTHYDTSSQTITWGIKYNYNVKNVAKENTLLRDFFNESQELIQDSFVVKKVTLDADGKEIALEDINSGYTITPKSENDKNGFEFQFDDDINSAYKIIYKTKAIGRVIGIEEIVNTVTTVDGKQATGKQNINQQILFKTNSLANYREKTVDWTITFNNDSHEMNNVIVTDTFTNKGLTLDPSSLKITTGSTTLIVDVDYKVTKNEENEFVIEFLNKIVTPHRITYRTKFDYEQREDKAKNYLQNKAILTWKDRDNKEQVKETVSNFHPDTYTQGNGFKNGSYNALSQEITWNVGINYNLKSLSNAIVEDMIQGNQQLLKDTIEIYKLNLSGSSNGIVLGDLVPEEDYSIIWLNNNGFQVKFKNSIKTPYIIKYKTSLKGLSHVESRYTNKATLYDDTEKETELNASVNIPYGGRYATKTGVQNGNSINWSISINFAQSKVSNAKITDSPNDDQRIIKNSIRLFSTNLQANGNVTKGELLIEGVDYELDFNESHDPYAFQLAFKYDIDRPYILEYQSLILKAPANITNKVSFNGADVKEDWIETSHSIQVKKTWGTGEGSGEIGSLRITKRDVATGEVLKGAQFALKDKNSGVVVKTGTTDENGLIQFDQLLFGDYILIETLAPKGYLKSDEEISITIDKEYILGDSEKAGNEILITNQKLYYAVQLIKVDENNPDVFLAGARFQLKDNDGVVVIGYEDLVTDLNGRIIVENLEPGMYQFVEIAAPSRYILDGTPVYFVIEEDQITLLELMKTNKRRSGGGGGGSSDNDDDDDPENPTDPGDEEDPNETTNPPDPDDGEDPTDPVNPTDPEDDESPIDPENPIDPKEEENPGSPTVPDDEGNPTNPVKSLESNSAFNDDVATKINGKNVLPQTGETYPIGIWLAGILSIMIGLFMICIRKRV